MATSLATPFYLNMGFSRFDVGWIAKNASLWPSVLGALFGGILMIKIGINRALWCFGFVQVISILGFAWLSIEGPFDEINTHQKILLALVIGFEALGVGLGIPRTLINSTTGIMVDYLGWTSFFGLCTMLAIPGMVLLLKVAPWNLKS